MGDRCHAATESRALAFVVGLADALALRRRGYGFEVIAAGPLLLQEYERAVRSADDAPQAGE